MYRIIFGKNCANTETHSFADICVNSNFGLRKWSFFTGTILIGISTLQALISRCHKYWTPDLSKN